MKLLFLQWGCTVNLDRINTTLTVISQIRQQITRLQWKLDADLQPIDPSIKNSLLWIATKHIKDLHAHLVVVNRTSTLGIGRCNESISSQLKMWQKKIDS